MPDGNNINNFCLETLSAVASTDYRSIRFTPGNENDRDTLSSGRSAGNSRAGSSFIIPPACKAGLSYFFVAPEQLIFDTAVKPVKRGAAPAWSHSAKNPRHRSMGEHQARNKGVCEPEMAGYFGSVRPQSIRRNCLGHQYSAIPAGRKDHPAKCQRADISALVASYLDSDKTGKDASEKRVTTVPNRNLSFGLGDGFFVSKPSCPAGGKRKMNTAYQEYLNSFHWKSIRRHKIKQVGKVCQICGRPGSVDGHHLTYGKRLKRLNQDHIRLLCRECHDVIHWLIDTGKLNYRSRKVGKRWNQTLEVMAEHHLLPEPTVDLQPA